MNHTVPPEGNPGNQNDSHPTADEQPAELTGNSNPVELAEYPIADEELLARLDPEIQELARHIGDKIANLTSQVDELDEEYERGWVDGSAKTAEALAGSPGAAYDAVTARALELRIEQLEVQVRDLRTVAEVFAASGKAEAIIDAATEGRRTAYLAGYSDGAAGRTLAAEGIDSAPDETDAGTPAVRAFTLGREIERRRWERLIDSEPGEGGEPR